MYSLVVVKVSGCVAIPIYSLPGRFLTLISTTRLLAVLGRGIVHDFNGKYTWGEIISEVKIGFKSILN